MTGAELMEESFKFLLLLSPVMLIFATTAYAEELIDLVRKSVFGRRERY